MMKFEQVENLHLNKVIEHKVAESKDYDTKEDFIAFCVKKELGLK